MQNGCTVFFAGSDSTEKSVPLQLQVGECCARRRRALESAIQQTNQLMGGGIGDSNMNHSLNK